MIALGMVDAMRYAPCAMRVLERRPTFLGTKPRPLFVMSPHSDDLDGLDLFQNLVDESMLNSDAAGISPQKISDQFFKGGRGLKGIFGKDFN